MQNRPRVKATCPLESCVPEGRWKGLAKGMWKGNLSIESGVGVEDQNVIDD